MCHTEDGFSHSEMFVKSFGKTATGIMADGGTRGWVVIVAALFSQFIVCGITYSLGIYHVLATNVFNATHFDASWICSWLLFSTALSSICLRVVTAKIGCPLSLVLGGLTSAVGLGLSVVVKELYQLYVTLGLITGLGFGLVCTSSIVAVETHFHQDRLQALNIALGGMGAGVITIPLIIHLLLERYAWRGMFLILAGFALNICVCGALLKPLHVEHRRIVAQQLRPMFSRVALLNPIFHAMCWSNLLWSFGSSIVYIYLPSYAMYEGTSIGMCVFLITCIGVAAFMCRLIFAFMGDTSTLDFLLQVLCSILLGMVVTGVCPDMFERFSGQIGYALLFGFYSGFWTTFMSQATYELVTPEFLAIGNGFLSAMVALGSLAAGPVAAWLLEEDGSRYKIIFYLAGSCMLCSSAIMTLFRMGLFTISIPSSKKLNNISSDKKGLIDKSFHSDKKIKMATTCM